MQGQEFNPNNTSFPKLSGLFLGVVVDNRDPLGLERVKVRVVGLHDLNSKDPEYSIWARRCCPSKYVNNGDIPEIGDVLYIMFLNEDYTQAVWLGWARTIAQEEEG